GRRLVGDPRVAEPAVGEPRRTPLLDLAVLLPAAPARASLLRRRPAGGLPAGAEQGGADAPARRRRRGDVLPARHPALRDRARAPRRAPAGARPAGGVRREDARVPRAAAARPRERRAPGRAL